MTRSSAAWIALGILAVTQAATPARAQDELPSAADLSLAKSLVTAMNPDPKQVVATMERPMVGMMEQLGVHDPSRARDLVQEALMPILFEHLNDLLDLQAKSYALLLTPADMRATAAFFDTKAGQDLVKTQPALAATQIQALTAWVKKLQPELVQRAQEVIKQRGWDHS